MVMKQFLRNVFTWLLLVGSLCCLIQVEALYDDNNAPYIKRISTTNDVSKMILKSDSIWMIQLYDPNNKESQSIAEMYTALGILMRGIFSIGVIDVSLPDSTKILEKLAIDTTTSTMVPSFYVIGDNRRKPYPVKGTTDTNNIPDIQTMADALMRRTTEQVSERSQKLQLRQPPPGSQQQRQKKTGPSKVIQLTSANFNEMVYNNTNVIAVAFTAPWCGHCKRLLPEWEDAAVQLDGSGAQLGWVDATIDKDLAQQFNVNGYPTIKVFPGGVKSKSFMGDDLRAERTASNIVRYMLDVVDKTGVPPPIVEMINEQTLLSNCGGHNQICVIAALPILLDSGASGRIKYRDDIMGTVAKTFRGTAYKFLWYEYTTQPTLEQTLELTFGSPAIVAINIERKAYALYRSSFSVKGITGFLHTITNGRTKVVPFPNDTLPKIEPVIAWDGQDAQPIEEEMSLEDIMGEEL